MHLIGFIIRKNIILQETWPMRIKVTAHNAMFLSATLKKNLLPNHMQRKKDDYFTSVAEEGE